VLFSSSIFGQDLGQLPARASQFWGLLQQSNRLAAVELVDPETRQLYLQGTESPILGFKVSGLEFTDNAGRVDVIVKVRSLIPRAGEIERIVHQAWVWKDGLWMMHAETAPHLFGLDDGKPTAPPPVPPKFSITNATIDVGRHSQGERLEGKIAFQAARDEIVLIRPLQSITGLAVGSAVWTSGSEGYLPYQWDTLLLPQTVNETLTLEARASSDLKASANVQLRARIDVKIGFKQAPEIIDPAKAGQLELFVQNLSSKPLKILGVTSPNRAYVVDDNVPALIEAGKSGRLLIRYSAQPDTPVGATIGFVFSETVGSSDQVSVPLNIKLKDQQQAPITREDLDRIIKTVPRTP